MKSFKGEWTFDSLKKSEAKVDRLLQKLTRTPGFVNLSRAILRDLKLAIIEGLANAIEHGKANRAKPVRIRMLATPKKIEVVILDHGPGFSLTRALKKVPNELDAGGRGLWIIKNLMDQTSYQKGRANRLVLIKHLSKPQNIDAAMEVYLELQNSLQELKPLNKLYEQFVDIVMGLFNVERASFLVLDPKKQVLRAVFTRGIPANIKNKIAVPVGEGISGYVHTSGRPLLVNNLSAIKKQGLTPRKKGYESQSFVSLPVIASPLHLAEENIGVLNLTDRRDGTKFTPRDLKLLNLMTTQAASIFRMRQLISEVSEHQSLRRELEIVSEIQGRMLPQEFPKYRGLQMDGRCQMSPRGGGDYFDVLQMGKVLRGVIADVSGHNVGSAITMASFRSMFRSLSYDPNTPGTLLRALRWALHEELVKLGQFISCWVWEYQGGNLRVSGAGHPPIIIFRGAKSTWEEVKAHHLPLGLEDESRIQNHTIKLKKGDWVYLYTDGLFDPRMRESGWDWARLQDLLAHHAKGSPTKVIDQVFSALSPHLEGLAHPDDVALLAIKKT